VFCACPTCNGWGLCPDKDLKFGIVKCWNCGGECIVDEITGKPVGRGECEETIFDFGSGFDLAGLCHFDEFGHDEN
jgi:hypothetical protein